MTVTSQDASSNTAAVTSATTVDLTGGGSGKFYSDSTCQTQITQVTIGQGSSSATFYFRDTTIENLTLDADDGGAGLTAGTLAVSVSANLRLAVGTNFTCARLTNGTVKCWGRSNAGQLGYEDFATRGDQANEMGANLPAVSLGAGRTVIDIAAGSTHVCVVLDNGSVKCWGYNANGELGLGHANNKGGNAGDMGDNLAAVSLGTGRTALAVTAGAGHTCALLDNRTVKCWGLNANGQLGLGDMDSRGDGANEMGDNLTAISLGTNRTAKAISAGGYFTCAILDNDSLKCWGRNNFGQLGQGDVDSRGDGANEMGDNLTAINLGTGRTALAVATGERFTCALLDNSSVKCFGNAGDGQLGNASTLTHLGDGANEMGDNLAAVDLGAGRTATLLKSGHSSNSASVCALLDNSALKCWGQNSTGQLGLGDTDDRGDGANEMGANLTAVNLGTNRTAVRFAMSSNHTCAVLDNNDVKCWGLNDYGQLGQGDTNDRGDGANEMGDNLTAISL